MFRHIFRNIRSKHSINVERCMLRISIKTTFNLLLSELIFIFSISAIYSLQWFFNFFDNIQYKIILTLIWFSIFFIPIIIFYLIIKCVKIKNLIGYITYNDSNILQKKIIIENNNSMGDVSSNFIYIDKILMSLNEKEMFYVRKNIKYYSWLMNKKNIQAIHCFFIIIAIITFNCSEYDLFPIVFILFIFGFVREIQAIIDIV